MISPFFSVIIACYNAEKYLKQSIESVRNQTFKDFEIIIVDDCSEDSSLAIADYYAQIDSKIKLVRTSANLGACAARNVAINYAKGQWLSILDADDFYAREKLEFQYRHIMSSAENLVLCGTACRLLDAEGVEISSIVYPSESHKLRLHLEHQKKFPPHSSIVIRTEVFRRVNGYNCRFLRSQDSDLFLRLSDYGTFASLQYPLTNYRIHESNLTLSATKQGYSQLAYGTAARVCHRLRRQKELDPSQADDEIWSLFMNSISSTLEKGGFQSYLDWRQMISRRAGGRVAHDLKIFFLIQALISSPSKAGVLVKEKVFGLHMAESCLRSWGDVVIKLREQ